MIDVNSIVEQCYQLLPSNIRQAPWGVLDHGRLVPETEEQLNAYIAAYGEMHMIKCRAALQNLPLQDFKLHGYEIFDWGCGQGIATLTAIEFLQERGLLGRLQRITLIEPSNAALSRAKIWVERYAGPGVEVRCVNRFIPNDTSFTWDDVSCDARISINLFSNILRGHGRHGALHPPSRYATVAIQGPNSFCRGTHGTDTKDDCHPPIDDAGNQHGGRYRQPDRRSNGAREGHRCGCQCHHAEPYTQ